jgi:hypothetical protein
MLIFLSMLLKINVQYFEITAMLLLQLNYFMILFTFYFIFLYSTVLDPVLTVLDTVTKTIVLNFDSF